MHVWLRMCACVCVCVAPYVCMCLCSRVRALTPLTLSYRFLYVQPQELRTLAAASLARMAQHIASGPNKGVLASVLASLAAPILVDSHSYNYDLVASSLPVSKLSRMRVCICLCVCMQCMRLCDFLFL